MNDIRRVPFVVVGAITLCAGFAYVLNSGYFFDDAYNSLLAAKFRYYHLSFWLQCWSDIVGGAASGRFAPFHYPLIDGFWVLFQPLALNRLAMLLANLAAAGTALACVYRTTRSLPFTGIIGVALVVLLRTHDFHSAITSYNGVLQFVLVCWCAAWWLLEGACERESLRRAIAAGLFLLAACLQNESGLAALPALLVVAVLSPARPRFKLTVGLILAASCGLFLLGYLLNRAFFVSKSYEGIALGIEPGVLRTLGFQLLAAIPGAEFLAAANRNFLSGPSLVRSFFTGSVLTIVGGSLWICRESYRNRGNAPLPRRAAAKLFATGLSWLLIPALEISISDKYQRFLTWGVGYMHVYLEEFGCALIFGSGIILLARLPIIARYSRPVWAAGTVVLVGAAAFFNVYNQKVVEAQNEHWKFPRQLLERSLAAELLDPKAPVASIVFVHERPYHQPFFIASWSGLKSAQTLWLDYPDHRDAIAQQLQNPGTSQLRFIDYSTAPGATGGFAVSGEVIGGEVGPPGLIKYVRPRLYCEWHAPGVPRPPYAYVPCLRFGDGTPYLAAFSLERLAVVHHTRDGVTFELPALNYTNGQIQFGPEPVQVKQDLSGAVAGLDATTFVGVNLPIANSSHQLTFAGEVGQYARLRGTVPAQGVNLRFKVVAMPHQQPFAKICVLTLADGRQIHFQHDWGDSFHRDAFRATYYDGRAWNWVSPALILDSGAPREITITLRDHEVAFSWDGVVQQRTHVDDGLSGQAVDVYWGNDSYSQTTPFSGVVEFL